MRKTKYKEFGGERHHHSRVTYSVGGGVVRLGCCAIKYHPVGVCLHDHAYDYTCVCISTKRPYVSVIWAQRGRTCWPLSVSHSQCFLLSPTLPDGLAQGLACGHPTRPILCPVRVSLCPSQLCHLSVWAVWTGKPSSSCLQ